MHQNHLKQKFQQRKKKLLHKNRQQLKEEEKVDSLQYLLLHLVYKKMKSLN
uniref:Uncharacterized protein n=1 Tax=uncultured marine virus TaxID=186617 RepID=A0A0F7L9A8_9VIRU|nr:hypothetical protein [uncultured marine virus]